AAAAVLRPAARCGRGDALARRADARRRRGRKLPGGDGAVDRGPGGDRDLRGLSARARLTYHPRGMRTLYHLPLSPYARKVRIALREKGLDFELAVEKVWERRPDFLAMNPAGTVPVLADEDGSIVVDSGVICEYLDESYEDPALLGATTAERNEI